MTLQEIDTIRQPLNHIRIANSNLRFTLQQQKVMTETASQLLEMIERNVLRISDLLDTANPTQGLSNG